MGNLSKTCYFCAIIDTPTKISKSTAIRFQLHTTVNDARHIYMYGNFNGWKANQGSHKLEAIAPGKYQLDLPAEKIRYPFNYKYHKGNLDQEELDEIGNVPPARRLKKGTVEVKDRVPRWRHNRLDL